MKQNFVLNTGVGSAERNMSLDAELLENLKEEPILHLYRWERPSVTYGCFLRPEDYFSRLDTLDFAKRPTGGGIVFHIWDLAFSFLMPASHPLCFREAIQNYRFVNGVVLEAVRPFLEGLPALLEEKGGVEPFCMAKPTIYDVVYQGKKIAGAAERRKRQGYLHQGTISLGVPDEELLRSVLKSEELIATLMRETSGPGEELREEIEKRLAQKFSDVL